ncbi:uncharacterized protein MELLADRAFT_124119 [Melampsora larici-populina 98AG31]|uniref:Secreted protein n=1 Tax=Melampsora larici-populina (strain 98AG31 / pathotype 3-4-7) TaxID=747676 RepID=F4RZV9_MELLP|nr:uncharacterized protein MELLADRAFT_124119 [Melampsora larici-populina 98AG31]EGG02118.1 secreted protein [Melampsora larici-populina 98AG31]
MPNSRADLYQVLFLWLFIATMSLQVSGQGPSSTDFVVNWRTTAIVKDPNGSVVLTMQQNRQCGAPDPDDDHHRDFTWKDANPNLPTQWKVQLSYADDVPFHDRRGHCSARSKATFDVKIGGVELHIRLNQLCSDETCKHNDRSGQFSCGIIHAPANTNHFFHISGDKEVKCT